MLDDETCEDLRMNRNLGVYRGALYENFVAEALSVHFRLQRGYIGRLFKKSYWGVFGADGMLNAKTAK